MKIKWLANSKKLALGCAYLALGGLLIYGLVARAGNGKTIGALANPVEPTWQDQGKIKVRTGLSQTKVLQGSDGLVYLQIDLEAPENAVTQAKVRKPTDFVVVLDHSGSMGDAKKMDYAHRAIESLINQLKPDDRFALVVFDDTAETTIPLTSINAENRARTIATVNGVSPDGSTNLGAGLMKGMDIIAQSRLSGNAHRILLVSDGLANVGIIDTQELSKIASQALTGEYTISTIGVGLDFNENLLSSIADHGAGNYHFLENLAVLDKVFADEFYGAGQIYANNLKFDLRLDPSVQLIEASGYPVSVSGAISSVTPGPIYAGQKKTFFVTLRIPTSEITSKALGSGVLNYQVEGKTYTAKLFSEELKVACLPPEKRQEAISSIQPGTFREAWTKNNYGRFLKDNAEKVSQGDEAGALNVIRDYKTKLSAAYSAAPAPEMKQQIEELDKMETEVSQAFKSPDSANDLKRLSKGYNYEGIQNQRKSN